MKLLPVAFLLLAVSCRTYPALQVRVAGRAQLPVVLVTPSKDHRNGLEAVFVQRDTLQQTVISEVTLVFTDEDQPVFFCDWCYDAYRRHHYGRKKDVETFFIYSDKATGHTDSLSFPGTWSGTQRFGKGFVQHASRTFPAPAFGTDNQRPLVYVNTWNHLFAPVDQNPQLPKDTIRTGPSFPGTRAIAEQILRR